MEALDKADKTVEIIRTQIMAARMELRAAEEELLELKKHLERARADEEDWETSYDASWDTEDS